MNRSYFRFFIFCILFLLVYVIWIKYSMKTKEDDFETLYMRLNEQFQRNQVNRTKYVLIWTLPHTDPLMYLGIGQDVLIRKKCKITNCYISTNKNLFESITQFDVILFSIKEIVEKKVTDLPIQRADFQKYVFASSESSDYYPLCDDRFNNYFNVTWTYKLNSDIPYGYIVVKNKDGKVIGPKEEMHWKKLEHMEPISDTLITKLANKQLAAAWFVSNCNAPSGRDQFVKIVQEELEVYNLTVDIYGSCGNLRCPRRSMAACLENVQRKYYFYFSFENSFSEDYVTEKLLHALQNYAIPVVYGAANYTRFMPEGIYLNAKELGPKKLVERMIEIINDKEKYYEFFKWHNYYTYHSPEDDIETDMYCKFCEKINDIEFMNRPTVIESVRQWWNPNVVRTKVCPQRRH